MSVSSDVTGFGSAPVRAEGNLTGEDLTRSPVSWPAIIAGALVAMAMTMILITLGLGVGFSIVSPWHGVGATAATTGVSTVIWLILVQWISSGMGGFIGGRLRTKWVRVHSHEVFFRDTAHGFLVWALASVVGAVIFTSATISGLGNIAKGTANMAGMAAMGVAQQGGMQNAHGGQGAGNDRQGYFVDTMFRSANPATGDKNDSRLQTTRILARSIQDDGHVAVTPPDKAYISQLIVAQTGVSQQEADQRVDNAVTQINDAEQKVRAEADVARKHAAELSIAVALSMVVGAFIACVAGAYGGSIRDEYYSKVE